MEQLISYIRVSTKKQGDSGLGLEAQQKVIADYVASCAGLLVAEYREVETGTSKKKRPELVKALKHAKRIRAKLVIAKLDRLSRNVYFISGLLESGVEFVACDMPTANRMTLQVMAVFAEMEASAISQRTKAALAAAKARGKVLGNPKNLTREGAAKGAQVSAAARRAEKVEAYAEVALAVKERRWKGMSLYAIAKDLNAAGHVTRMGKEWTAVQVSRVLAA